MEPSKSFHINISSFDGDPSKLEFFCEQYLSVCTLNKLGDEAALILLKSKLTGAAEKFYSEAKYLHTIKEPKELLKKLKEFFLPQQNNFAYDELKNIAMLPGENIQSLSHRIQRLSNLIYPELSDEALQQIMLVSLFQAIPKSMKAKLIEKNCKTFNEATEQAQLLYVQYTKHNILNYLVDTPSTSHVENEVASLRQEIFFLKASAEKNQTTAPKNTEEKSAQSKHNENRYSKSFRPQRNKTFVEKKNFKHRNNRKTFVCQFCDRPGHTAKFCRRYQAQQNRNVTQNMRRYTDQHSKNANQVFHCSATPSSSGTQSECQHRGRISCQNHCACLSGDDHNSGNHPNAR